MYCKAYVIIITTICLFISACYTSSLNPLSDPSSAKYDQRLGGVWFFKENGKNGYIHIGKGANNVTQALLVGTKDDGSIDFALFNMFPTDINQSEYMNIVLLDRLGGNKKEISGYFILRYELANTDKILLYSFNRDELKLAVDRGKLLGNVSNENAVIDFIKITDSSENITKYLKSVKNTDKLFNKPLELIRVRVENP